MSSKKTSSSLAAPFRGWQPSRAEIAAATQEIQAGWDEMTRKQRGRCETQAPKKRIEHWQPPQVDLPDTCSQESPW